MRRLQWEKQDVLNRFYVIFFFSHDADVAERSVGEITSWPRLVVTSEKGFVIVWINYMNTF